MTRRSDPGGTGATTIDGCRIAYRRAGTDGPPIVLLHGGGVDDATLSWRHVLENFGADYRLYALDWPGYGDSEAGDGFEHSIERYATLLEGFLDDVGLASATVAGISMGGAAALRFALDRPDRVDRLVLVDSYGLGREVPAGSSWFTLAHTPMANQTGWNALSLTTAATRMALSSIVSNAAALDPEFVAAVRERAGRSGAGSAFAAFQRNELAPDGTARTDFSGRLESVAVPTLLVHGTEDRLFPVEWAERAHDRIPNSRLELLADCGHWPPRERPDAFEAILRSFLEETERDPPVNS